MDGTTVSCVALNGAACVRLDLVGAALTIVVVWRISVSQERKRSLVKGSVYASQ
jgi:hypothetical protein